MGLNLEYELENIGNIDNATITIKPLTIIAGQNSSGKTFVTKSLYTILNAVYKNHFANKLIQQFHLLENSYQRFYEKLHNPASIDIDFEETFSRLGQEIKVLIGELTTCEFERQEDILKNHIETILVFENEIVRYLTERKQLKKFEKYSKDIERVMAKTNEFMNTIDNRRSVIIDNIANDLETGFKKNFQIVDLHSLVNRDKKKNIKLSLESIGEIGIDQKSVIDFNFFGKGIQTVQNVENIIFFDSPIYIKIRQALQKNKTNTLNLLFARNEDKYLKGYPEYLDQLYNFIDKEYIAEPDFYEISQNIEKIISGKIQIPKSGDIHYTDNNGHTIPLSLTAMGISNIGLIGLLLRNNVINKGSFLIMDEPEVHLHPEWQVALANILYDIAKSGANVIIATHSLDFLKAFESIIGQENEAAEKIIAINKMPFDKSFTKLTEAEKVDIVLDDLSKPFYDLYMQDV